MIKLFCKHKENYTSSCPFTGNTYTYCTKCDKKLKTEPTMRSEVKEALDEMLTDPKTHEILRRLGSDYDKNGKPYWEQ